VLGLEPWSARLRVFRRCEISRRDGDAYGVEVDPCGRGALSTTASKASSASDLVRVPTGRPLSTTSTAPGELDHCFRAAGVTRGQLEVAVANTTAITLYERLGYEVVATRAE
jgi:hypothetical protein